MLEDGDLGEWAAAGDGEEVEGGGRRRGRESGMGVVSSR